MAHGSPTLATGRSLANVHRLRALTVLSVVLLGAVGCASENDSQPNLDDPAAAAAAALTTGASTTPSTVPTGDEAPPVTVAGEIINEYTLGLDDCFNRDEHLDGGKKVVTTTRLPCETPHDAQIFHTLSYPADGQTPFPGLDVIEDFAMASCYQSFGDWVGISYELSALEIRVITPNRSNYEQNRYRGIHCYVEHDKGEALTGSSRASRR